MTTVTPEVSAAFGGPEIERITQAYGQPDVHIAPDGDDGLMMPIFPGVFVRHLSFDVRNNAFTNITSVPDGGMIGRHRHRDPARSTGSCSKAAGATWNMIGWRGPAALSMRARA